MKALRYQMYSRCPRCWRDLSPLFERAYQRRHREETIHLLVFLVAMGGLLGCVGVVVVTIVFG
jgi:hypothetical protein